MVPRRAPRHWWQDHDPFALHVFVPGIMGAGILVSLVLLVVDALRAVGLRGSARRPARVLGTKVGAEVLGAQPEGLRSLRRARSTYVAVGIMSCAVAVYTMIGSFWNFINPALGQNWVEDVAWLFALSLVVSGGLAVLGTASLRLARRDQPITPLGWWLLARTPLGTRKMGSGGHAQPAARLHPPG
jgi:hypothetical protein